MSGTGSRSRVYRVGAVALMVLAAAGAGGIGSLYRSRTPERAMAQVVAAARAGDQDRVHRYLCANSQDLSITADLPFSLLAGPSPQPSHGGEPSVTVRDGWREGDDAVVPVTCMVATGEETVEREVEFVLVRERWDWRVDLQKTRQRTLRGLLNVFGK